MTEPYYDDNDNDDSDDRSVTLKRSAIRTLEKDAKEARQARAEVEQLRREMALTRAGLGELTERQTKALLASIDGDLTADSAREAATDLGFIKPAAPETPSEERTGMQQMAQASAGATDPGSEDSIARLQRVAREGGKEALLAQIQADGHSVVQSG